MENSLIYVWYCLTDFFKCTLSDADPQTCWKFEDRRKQVIFKQDPYDQRLTDPYDQRYERYTIELTLCLCPSYWGR